MMKSMKALVIGAVMTVSVFAASISAMAATQFVQNDMNFRNGASITSTIIGSVPAGAKVEVLDLQNGWNLVRYNGTVGYIHGGNLADSYTAKKAAPASNNTAPAASTAASTKAYFDSNWSQTAQNMSKNVGAVKTVNVSDGYLALRSATSYDAANEIGQLRNGDTVTIQGGANGSYVMVYSPKYNANGWVNAGFLK
ncbi:MAG: SH3 domain-containing protein [Lachnospiraceae bacterium]|nr:SH3 domain-containing protein [Lachnospiraceae bacterium]